MIFDVVDDLNWLAVVVAALAWFVFSSIWYSIPPISGAWQRASKVDMNQQGAPLPSILVSTFVVYVIIAALIAVLAGRIGAVDALDGLELGVALGLAFGVGGALIAQMYEQKGSSYWLINGVNAVVSFSIVSIIVTVWD